MRWMDVLVRVLFISQKQIVVVGKSKVTTTKEQRATQAGCTATSTERRAHRTAHFTAARKPTACIFFSAFRRMRLTHSAVVSKAYVKTDREAKRSNNASSVKNTQERAIYKKSIRRTKRTGQRYRSSKERCPRDGSPLSVIVGVDRGHVLV